MVATRPHFIAITSDVFDAERHYITIWIGCDYASGEAAPVADYELSEVGWFRADALPEPLFLAFSHLVNGESLPPDAWRSV